MAETALISPQKPSAADSETALFHRRIEFHVAKRPFNGFSNNGTSNGFKLVTLNPNSDTHYTSSSSSSGQKLDKSNLSDNGFDPELSFQITFRRIGAGLRNLGNTCFLNSVLQCLTYTEPLAAYLQSGKHQSSCRTAGFCALCAIQKHVSRALQSTGRILEPKDLVSNLRCISRSFRNARQEDAHEYMVNLLESMHKCCLPSGVPSESASAYEKSLVHKIFGGRLRSQVKCMQCSFCSNKFDPFLDLSLEIHKADSVLKALAHFTAKEQLDGGAKQYQCQQCKQKVRALKQLTIHKAPHVLTVHLKRFGSHVPRQKIDKKIAFDRTLDLKPFVTGPYDGDLKYTLYGVLVHAGWSTHSGHYYCFVRTSSGMWYSLDDNQVVQVSEKKAMEQKAYMLFYVRDRRNIVTKKPVDIIQKENMVMHAIENTASSKFNLEFKGKIQNCSVEKKVDGSFSGAISEREAPVVTVPKEIPSDKVLVQNVNGRIAAENSSVVPPMKDSKKDASINLLGHKVESHSSQGNVYANLPQDSLHKNGSIPSVCYNDRANGNPSGVAEQPPDRSVMCKSNGGTCKINSTNPETCDSKTIPSVTVEAASNEVNKVKSSKQNRTEKDLVGGSLPMSCGSTIGETWENKRGMEDVQSKIPAATHLSSGVANKRLRLNFKRKLFKCQVATMLLSSYIIFGQPRNKMHKNRKRVSLQNKSLNGKNSLVDNELPLTLGQSVSEKSSHVPIEHCTPSKKKKVKRGAANEGQSLHMANINGNGNISSDASNEEFKERILNLSAEMEPQRRQSANEGPGNYKNYARESRQNDLMSMLTRGVEETTVALWDGIGVSPKENLEPRTAGTAQIGYIGDEWDEEYDRGKRKKIRESKSSFGGPNPFQEIAAKKCGRKRAKLDRASSAANQPFRIL